MKYAQEAPMSTNMIITIVLSVVLGVLFLTLLGLSLYTMIKKHKIKKSEQKVTQQINDSTTGLILALGGKDNIKTVEVMGSRVRVLLNDYEKINREEVLKLHDSVLFMNDKVTFVVGSLSQEFAAKLNEHLQDEIKG